MTGGLAVLGGKAYFNPCYPDEYRAVVDLLRGTGNYLIACALDPAWKMPDDLRSMFTALTGRMDFANCASDGVINLLHGYWLCFDR